MCGGQSGTGTDSVSPVNSIAPMLNPHSLTLSCCKYKTWLTECFNNTQELVITKYKGEKNWEFSTGEDESSLNFISGTEENHENSPLKISVITNGKCQTFLGDTAKNNGQWQHARPCYWCCTSRNYKIKLQHCNLPETTSSVFNLDELPVRSIHESCHTPVL